MLQNVYFDNRTSHFCLVPSVSANWLIDNGTIRLTLWKIREGKNLKIMTTFPSGLLFHTEGFFKRISIQFILIQNKRKPTGSSAAAVNVCGCIWVEGGIQFYIHLRPDTWWNILSQSPEYPLLSPCQISASDGYFKKSMSSLRNSKFPVQKNYHNSLINMTIFIKLSNPCCGTLFAVGTSENFAF